MEQRPDHPSADEIDVAKILVEMSYLILESESRPRFPFPCGVKKERSVHGKDDAPTPPSLPPVISSPPAVAASRSFPGTVLVWPPTEMAEASSSSPATPLLFLPSEHEGNKPKPPKKRVSSKRRREEQLQLLDELTLRKQLLQTEIENVKSYHSKLKAYNLTLKARKQKLISPGMKKKASHGETQFTGPLANHHRQQLPPLHYQQPFVINRTVQMHQTSEVSEKNSEFRYGQTSLLEVVRDKVDPNGIPDLNLSTEEEELGLEYSEPFDLNRVRAAQARLRRKQICKAKNL